MQRTASSEALEILQKAKHPISVKDILANMTLSPPRSTVARALRRHRSKGTVTSKRNGGRWVLWSFNWTQPAKVQVRKQSLKGGSRRNTMCRPDNMPTLCKAIDDQVAAFITDKKEFSAFDVTKSLRDNVATLGIDTAETGTVHVAGNDVAKIDHELVKEVVHDLFHRDEMPGYGRTHSNGFWLYGEMPDDPPDDLHDDDQNDTPASSDGGDYDGSPTLS